MPSLQYAKLGLLAAAAIVSLAQTATAAPGSPPGAKMMNKGNTVLTHDPRKLVTTYVSVGNGFGSALAAGTFNTIESRTVNCANVAGCHIGQEAMVQLSTTGNWAICTKVNTAYTTCQYQGNLPDISSFVVGNSRGFGAVPQGVHTVQTDVFVDVASSLNAWQTDHRVYKP